MLFFLGEIITQRYMRLYQGGPHHLRDAPQLSSHSPARNRGSNVKSRWIMTGKPRASHGLQFSYPAAENQYHSPNLSLQELPLKPSWHVERQSSLCRVACTHLQRSSTTGNKCMSAYACLHKDYAFLVVGGTLAR